MVVKMATLTETDVTHGEVTSATGLVNTQISFTAVETPQVIGSFPLSEDSAAPVYNQVNQEQIPAACSRAPVFEYVAPAPVTEYIAPAPAVTSDAHSQQSPSVYTTTTVTTDVNLDTIGLVYPQFSSTAVEPFSPQVVGSLPLLEEFDGPVYNQVHQEQIVAGTTREHRIENPAVQDQVIIQEIPQFQKFGLWSGYRNEFLIPSKCFHMSVYNCTPLHNLCTCQSLRSRI